MRKPFIIAEIGINHNGSLDTAKKLIDMAVACDCDAVKFQKRDVETVYTKKFLESHRDSPFGNTQGAQKHGIELTEEDYLEINNYCIDKGIDWFASAWDMKSLKSLRKHKLQYNKIASAILTHRDIVTSLAGSGKHTFISTGMGRGEDIAWAVNSFSRSRTPFTLMHAVSTYPCDDKDCNLSKIKAMADRFKCPVGYSGHERGIVPSLMAVMLGAEAIERHITLDRTMYGSDQSASLERRGLEILVREARAVKDIMGDGNFNMLDAEKECAKKLRYWEQDDLA